MAGTPAVIENVDREDFLNHRHLAVYHSSQSTDTLPPAYTPRSENVEAGAAPHQLVENVQAEAAEPKVLVTGATEENEDDAGGESFQKLQISFHKSKVTEGLSKGEWDEAENHLSTLLKDFNIGESPDMLVLQAMTLNSRARWQEALDLLKDFKHQSASEPELSVRAYYAKAVALYKLKDYEACHTNCRRGINVIEKFLSGDAQQRYRSEFGELASRSLEDLGSKADSAKAEFYKSLISSSYTSDPILLVTTVSQSTVPITAEQSEAERKKLMADMERHSLSFGYDGKILVGRKTDIFLALHDALKTDNLPLMTLICSNEWCAGIAFREAPIFFDLDPPMPQYAWRATTLLHVVAGSHSKYSAPMAQLLLDNGADPQKTLFEGITPLHICARQTNAEVASVLIKNGANIEARSITGKPPIHFAAWKASWNADVRILKMLIAAGANINAKNSGGYTALHWCMFDGRSAAPIEVLLERPEIDKYVRATNHKTPWDIFWEHEEEFMEKGEEKRVQILYTLRRYGINR
ncbi:Ankyrin-3 [Dactylella cylindrospora]|nr:Ankyrin-3 [Dactylella cylindrospora]